MRVHRSCIRPSRGRKTHTADCGRCVIMGSLREAGVHEPTIQAVCESMWLHRARRRQLLFSEGNGATHLYAIRSGRVKLFRIDASGRPRVTALLEAGDLFGFESIFDETYDSFAEAMTDCELCLASADLLQQLIADVPRIAGDLARYLHRQLARTRQRQFAVTATGATAKVAGFLLLSEARGGADDDGSPTVARDLTLSDLGGLVGISAETACRVLADLKADGVLEARPAGLRVRDRDRLRQLAGG